MIKINFLNGVPYNIVANWKDYIIEVDNYPCK